MTNRPAPPNGPSKTGGVSGNHRGNNAPRPGSTPPPAPKGGGKK